MIDTGEVSRSCSVFAFLSSEKDFIVRRGSTIAERIIIKVKKLVTSADIENSVV
jgi:hypothetical protein